MFLLSLIPDTYLYLGIFAIIATGIVLYLFSFLLALIPPLIPYKKLIQGLSLLLILIGVYFTGGYSTEMEWRKRVEEMQAKVAKAEEQSKQANAKLDNKAHQKVKVIREKGLVIKQYIDREVTKYDSQCVIPKEFVKAHNDSAEATK